MVREVREVRTRAGRALLVDLPGTGSFDDRPVAGRPFWAALLAAAPDAILVVIDAGDVARHLPLVIACRDLGLPVVVALNLADEAWSHGIAVDAGRLGQLLALPVRRTVARTGEGVAGAVALAVARAHRRRGVRAGTHSPRALVPAGTYPPDVERALASAAAELPTSHALGAAALDPSGLGALVAAGALSPRGAATVLLPELVDPVRRQLAARWATEVEGVGHRRRPFADRLAAWSIRPWPGLLILAAVLAATFALVSVGGAAAASLLSGAWAAFASPVIDGVVRTLVPVPQLASGSAVGPGLGDPRPPGDRDPVRADLLPRDRRARGFGLLASPAVSPTGSSRPWPVGSSGDPTARRDGLQRAGDLRDAGSAKQARTVLASFLVSSPVRPRQRSSSPHCPVHGRGPAPPRSG